jgi:hypothetical protein
MSLFDEYYGEYTELVKKIGELTTELLNSNPFSADAHLEASLAIEKTITQVDIMDYKSLPAQHDIEFLRAIRTVYILNNHRQTMS